MAEIGRVLGRLGLPSSPATVNCNIGLSKADNILVDAYLPDGSFIHFKASEYVYPETEYRAMMEAIRWFPQFLPRPLGLFREGAWGILASQGVSAAPLPPQFPQDPRLVRQVTDFFGCARQSALPLSSTDNALAHLSGLSLLLMGGWADKALAPWVSGDGALRLRELPLVPQHGDFAINNLFLAKGRLVVFDWEDYGKVLLPGLDVFSLILVLAQFDLVAVKSALTGIGQDRSGIGAFARAATLSLGMEFELFRALVPVYLLVFQWLRQTYGSPIREQIGDMLLVPGVFDGWGP
jgi:hypothetical protein